MVIAVHQYLRLLQRVAHQAFEGVVQHLPFRTAQRQPEVGAKQPFREQAHLALQQLAVVRRQPLRISALDRQQGRDGIGVQPVHIARVQLAQVQAVAQILQQQETLAEILRVDMRHVRARLFQAPGDIDEGPAILLVRRRIHHHAGPLVSQVDAEVTPETGVRRGRCESIALQAAVLAQPLPQLGLASRHAPSP